MRLLIHLSDIHFGAVDYRLLNPLIEHLWKFKPDLVAVSGDLTQRARTRQFKEARSFLNSLPLPQIVVPGNHDISAHNLYNRFLRPLDKYCRYITNDLHPFFADDEVAIIGVNTARSLVVKGGRINSRQIAHIRSRMQPLGDEVTKIVVTHHPFDLPPGFKDSDLVGRARLAIEMLATSGIDLFLAGHMHVGHTGHTAERYKLAGHSSLVVQAGTATSTRGRGEANSFNVIHIAHPYITVERYQWQKEREEFAIAMEEHFQHSEKGWTQKRALQPV